MDPVRTLGVDDVATRRQLIDRGCTDAELAAAVRTGHLTRIRRGFYAGPGAGRDVVRAARVGGRLTCISELRRRGIWVVDDHATHVQLPRNASRVRAPDDAGVPPDRDMGCRIHWLPLLDPLHQRLITPRDLRLIHRSLPRGRAALLARADAAAESGLETIVRLLAIDLGFRVRSQPAIPGVGREDLEIEGHVIIETDGAEHHGAAVTTRDRRRDAAVTARGKTVLHFRYAQVLFERRAVAEAIISAVASHRGIHRSGWIAARARQRLEDLDLS